MGGYESCHQKVAAPEENRPWHGEEQQFLRGLINGMRCGILAIDRDGHLVMLNEIGAQILGLDEIPPTGTPIGRARIAREGHAASIVTYGMGVNWALEAAGTLATEGRELEVIDLRSLMPWDVETVVASVKKTGRAFVLHEASVVGGFGGELAATLGREAFEWLERAYEERDAFLVWVKLLPPYDPLRDDPRFDVLLEKMGLK